MLWNWVFFCFINLLHCVDLAQSALLWLGVVVDQVPGMVHCVIFGAILIVGSGNFWCIYVIVLCLFFLMLAVVSFSLSF